MSRLGSGAPAGDGEVSVANGAAPPPARHSQGGTSHWADAGAAGSNRRQGWSGAGFQRGRAACFPFASSTSRDTRFPSAAGTGGSPRASTRCGSGLPL